jgi:hypothetical protein
MNYTLHLVVGVDGSIRCIYGEVLDFAALGSVTITRASQVEPTSGGRWLADLAPVGGPVLGPFDRRGQALAAEQDWLDEHWLSVSV